MTTLPNLLDLLANRGIANLPGLGPSVGDDGIPRLPLALGPCVGDDLTAPSFGLLGPSVGDDNIPGQPSVLGPCVGDDQVQ